MITMIEAGESSGTLDSVMKKLASQFENEVKLRRKVNSAMTYPIVLIVLCIGMVVLLMTVIMPSFMQMFEGLDELPALTRMMLAISDALADYWYIFLFVVILLIVGIPIFIKSDGGRKWIDGVKLRFPVFGPLMVKVISVRFCRTFSTLFSSGMAVLPILEIVGRVVDNRVISNELANVREDIRKGISLSRAVSRVKQFPPLVHSMISIGEESGMLDTVMESTAEYFDDEVESSIQRMTTLIEPALLIFMGVIVGMIVASLLLPIVTMMEHM
jgi:type IV pilus assembly protein PilC